MTAPTAIRQKESAPLMVAQAQKVVVVITALNEERGLHDLLYLLNRAGREVILVDDGSTDRTRSIAVRMGATVIHHDTPRGIGPSLLEAWRLALAREADIIVQMDAGGSHDPRDISALIAGIDLGADMVIGTRFSGGGEYLGRTWRALLSRLASVLLNLTGKARLSDWTSGYRAFTHDALYKLAIRPYHQIGHAWQIEVLAQAIRYKFGIAEAPITYRAGRSSLRLSTVSDAITEWLCLFFE